jgi:hypothetical protein
MSEHKQLKKDNETTGSKWPYFMRGFATCGLLIATILALTFGSSFIPDLYENDEIYVAYTLNEQYVGDITGFDNVKHHDILIMNATKQQYAYGSKTLKIDYSIFGNLIIHDSKYLTGTNETTQLYFTGEHELKEGLSSGKTIIARWVRVNPERYVIQGFWNYDEVKFR